MINAERSSFADRRRRNGQFEVLFRYGSHVKNAKLSAPLTFVPLYPAGLLVALEAVVMLESTASLILVAGTIFPPPYSGEPTSTRMDCKSGPNWFEPHGVKTSE